MHKDFLNKSIKLERKLNGNRFSLNEPAKFAADSANGIPAFSVTFSKSLTCIEIKTAYSFYILSAKLNGKGRKMFFYKHAEPGMKVQVLFTIQIREL